jgi:argininosuccinate lyase
MSHIRGRLQKAAHRPVNEYTASLPFDWRLYQHDIAGSIAHTRMLAKQGIISNEDAVIISQGLEAIREEIERGQLSFHSEQEDIHMTIEARLMEKVGEVGAKLHTARSRNDQIALDLRLFAREAIEETLAGISQLQRALVAMAEANMSVVIPGYTHLQPAQPVLLAHHLLAYFEMLQRDFARFQHSFNQADVLPLGSGALAGVAYDIDREFLARELGFGQVSQNSLDAVSDRDFLLEYEAAASICMMHLSRLAEEIVLWSSAEFNFIVLDEAYATTSSIMPQKKNPDVAELARGKTGRVYGHLMALLTTLKALPLAYNRDLQEDKEGFFDAVDTLLATLEVFAGLVAALEVNTASAERAIARGYLLATDLADYLVKKGEPFRNAHDIVARLVRYAENKGKSFADLSLTEYQGFSPLFGGDVSSVTVETSLAARDAVGGTAPKRVAQALAAAKKIIQES